MDNTFFLPLYAHLLFYVMHIITIWLLNSSTIVERLDIVLSIRKKERKRKFSSYKNSSPENSAASVPSD